MSSPLAAITSLSSQAIDGGAGALTPAAHRPASSFARMLARGLDHVDQLQAQADQAVTAFALDDRIPPHRVMFALDEARGSLQMMLQVRNHLVQSYLDLSRMQI